MSKELLVGAAVFDAAFGVVIGGLAGSVGALCSSAVAGAIVSVVVALSLIVITQPLRSMVGEERELRVGRAVVGAVGFGVGKLEKLAGRAGRFVASLKP